jgi:hypothetical protein
MQISNVKVTSALIASDLFTTTLLSGRRRCHAENEKRSKQIRRGKKMFAAAATADDPVAAA